MSELKVVNIKNVQGEQREPPRTSWILISEKTVGAQNLAMGVNKTHPGGEVPLHTHEAFITEDEEIDLEPGVCIYNPPGGKHKIVNTGDEDLEFIWIYSPQLPSHRKQ